MNNGRMMFARLFSRTKCVPKPSNSIIATRFASSHGPEGYEPTGYLFGEPVSSFVSQCSESLVGFSFPFLVHILHGELNLVKLIPIVNTKQITKIYVLTINSR